MAKKLIVDAFITGTGTFGAHVDTQQPCFGGKPVTDDSVEGIEVSQ